MAIHASAEPAAEHRTVARVMAILELVIASEDKGQRLGDLANALEAPKSTVHGLAKGLVAEGYLRGAGGRYFTGPAISSLLATGPAAVPAIYHHTLEQLARRWNETAMLGTLVGDFLVYIDAVEPETLIRAAPQLHERLSLWPRSGGKCLLAFMDTKRLESYLKRRHGAAERDAIRIELDHVRKTRIGLNVGQSIAEHIGIASPILIGQAPPTMTISLAGPKIRMQDKVDDIAEALLAASESLAGRAS
jgi:DNA-binding IclR family transcriptional regulator